MLKIFVALIRKTVALLINLVQRYAFLDIDIVLSRKSVPHLEIAHLLVFSPYISIYFVYSLCSVYEVKKLVE